VDPTTAALTTADKDIRKGVDRPGVFDCFGAARLKPIIFLRDIRIGKPYRLECLYNWEIISEINFRLLVFHVYRPQRLAQLWITSLACGTQKAWLSKVRNQRFLALRPATSNAARSARSSMPLVEIVSSKTLSVVWPQARAITMHQIGPRLARKRAKTISAWSMFSFARRSGFWVADARRDSCSYGRSGPKHQSLGCGVCQGQSIGSKGMAFDEVGGSS